MGKKRIVQLLEQLQTNHDADLQTSAAIFTTAQVAVNQLKQQAVVPAVDMADNLMLPSVSKESLKQRYGSFNQCRNVAKQKGIRFRKTPSWEQLEVAFAYFDVLEALVQGYVRLNPNPLFDGVAIEFMFEREN